MINETPLLRQAWLISALLAALPCPRPFAQELSIAPASMARVGTVDERFQSYNAEMIEVTGGRFWKPYGSSTPGERSDLYEYRPPIDLANPRLRKLAAAVAPAYLRISGSWTNATYFAASDSTGSRRATPLSLFQHSPGQFPTMPRVTSSSLPVSCAAVRRNTAPLRVKANWVAMLARILTTLRE